MDTYSKRVRVLATNRWIINSDLLVFASSMYGAKIPVIKDIEPNTLVICQRIRLYICILKVAHPWHNSTVYYLILLNPSAHKSVLYRSLMF
jgi:hypothetical protein